MNATVWKERVSWTARKLLAVLAISMFAASEISAQAEISSPGCSIQESREWVIQNGIYSLVVPDYPAFARSLGQQGRLLAAITTDPEGRIVGARVLRSSGFKELDEGVLDALNKKHDARLTLPACAPPGKNFSFSIPLYYKYQEATSPAKRELVIEYFKVTNSWDALTLAAPKLTHTLFGVLRQRHPDAPAETLDIITDEVRAVLKKEMGEGSPYAERLIDLHQQIFTEEDIRRLIIFYRTPLGRKVIGATPTLLAEAAALGERMGESVMLLIVDRTNARLKERGYPYSIAPPKPGPKANQAQGNPCVPYSCEQVADT